MTDKKISDEQLVINFDEPVNKKSNILEAVCKLIVDCEHKTAPTQQIGYPSIRTPNIGKGKLILDGVNRVSEETYKTWTKRTTPQADDLILAREAPIGNVAIIPKNLKVCLGQRTVLIRPDKTKVNPNYLCYLLLGDGIQNKFISVSNGSTVHHLNVKDIRNLELPEIPPLPTQQKIASILSAYDDLIENNTKRIKILEEMAQTLYREWFVNFRFPSFEQVQMVESELGLIPQGWETPQIQELIERGVLEKNQDGNHGEKHPKSNDYVPSGVPFIMAKDLSDNILDLKNCNFLSPEQAKSLRIGFAKAGDVLITHKATMGRVAIVPNINNFIVLTPQVTYFRVANTDLISNSFLYCTFTSERFQDILLTQSEQSTRKFISITNQRNIRILYPKTEIIKSFTEFVEPILNQKQSLYYKNSILRQTRDLLLPKLISGEIDVESLDIDTKPVTEAIAA